MNKYMRFILPAVIIALLVSGCAMRYLPAGGDDLIIVGDAYIYHDNDAELVAQSRYWVKDPQDLNDYFTTFYVTVKNRTDQKLNISKSNFALLDQMGNQSDPLDAQQIEDILLHNELQYLVVKNIEEQEDKSFVSINDYSQTDKLKEWRRAKKNLISESFTFGEIFPQAKRTGYIFFPKADIKNDQLTLVYKGKLLKFSRE